MYAVADFGHYELYFAIATLTTSVSMFGYERSILLENTPQGQFDGLLLSAFCLVCVTIAATIFLLVYGRNCDDPHVSSVWTWALPSYVLLAGTYNLLSTYLTRLGNFSVLARLKIGSTSVAMISQVGFALCGIGFIGIVISNLISQLIVVTYLGVLCCRRVFGDNLVLNRHQVSQVAWKHWRLPILFLPGNFMAGFTNSIPTMFFANMDINLLGYYAFTRRILGLPLNAIGSSLQRVYSNALSNEIENTGQARNVVMKSFCYYLTTGTILFIGLVLVGVPLIPYLFGSQWTPAIPYVVLFGIEFCNKFVFGGLSSLMFYGKLPKYDIIWQVLNICSVVTCFFLASLLELSVWETVIAYVMTSALSYQLYGVAIIWLSNRSDLLTAK